MIQKTTLSFFKVLFLFSIIVFTKSHTYAQTVIVPQPFDGLEKICAGNSFNEYYATFTHQNFPEGTTFEIELSDSSGSFTNPIATTKLSVTNASGTQQTIKFAVPVTLVGSDTYSVRVKSSTGTVSARFRNSADQTSFAAYFKSYETSFGIFNKNGSAIICAGGSVTLTVDNDTPSDIGSSPATFPDLKYKWYKDDVLIAGQSSKTLVANQPGVYYSQIDYGLCSDPNISSNRVTVASSSSGSVVTISSSLGNPFCASGGGTILTATSGNSYVWKKDGNVINGATGKTYQTNDSGIYTVDVDFGGCIATGTIDLKSNSFEASIDVPENNTIGEGESLNVSITTDAASPTFEWYLNGNLISGANSSSFEVKTRGNYRVKISQASGCISSKEFTFKVTSSTDAVATVIPNIIKLSGLNPYWNIPDQYKNESTKVMIISSNGDMVLDMVNYQGDWPQSNIDFKNVNPVYYYVIQSDTGEKKGSITVIK